MKLLRAASPFKTRGIFAALGLLLAFLAPLSGCERPAPEPLRIASSPWPGYEPLYLARDLGYFDAERVALFELPSSDITMESFRNRSSDIASLTLDEVLELLHDGVPLRIMLVMDISNGADAVMAAPSIKKLSDLKGKRIATTNIPLGFYMLSRLLEKAGLSRADVQVFPMAESAHEAFYREKRADAAITFEPFKTRLAQAGAHKIFDSADIPNEIFDLLVVHEDAYLARRGEVCAIARQWYRTLAYMRSRPDDAAQRVARRLGVDVGEYRAMMEGIVIPPLAETRRLLWGGQPAIVASAQKLTAVMLRERQLQRPVDVAAALDPSFSACFDE